MLLLLAGPLSQNRVSAFQKAVKVFVENPTENGISPVLSTTFDSLGEAYDFYNLYFWEKGFGIRYGKSQLNVERRKCMQKIVCGCSVRNKFRLVMLVYWMLFRRST